MVLCHWHYQHGGIIPTSYHTISIANHPTMATSNNHATNFRARNIVGPHPSPAGIPHLHSSILGPRVYGIPSMEKRPERVLMIYRRGQIQNSSNDHASTTTFAILSNKQQVRSDFLHQPNTTNAFPKLTPAAIQIVNIPMKFCGYKMGWWKSQQRLVWLLVDSQGYRGLTRSRRQWPVSLLKWS